MSMLFFLNASPALKVSILYLLYNLMKILSKKLNVVSFHKFSIVILQGKVENEFEISKLINFVYYF